MNETKEIVKEIDDAVYLENDLFKGKFGICRFKDLSTGCKSVLLSAYFRDSKIVSFVGCGDNAYNCANNLNFDCHIYANRPFILDDIN